MSPGTFPRGRASSRRRACSRGRRGSRGAPAGARARARSGQTSERSGSATATIESSSASPTRRSSLKRSPPGPRRSAWLGGPMGVRKATGCADRHGHQETLGARVERLRRAQGDGTHHGRGRGLVHGARERHRPDQDGGDAGHPAARDCKARRAMRSTAPSSSARARARARKRPGSPPEDRTPRRRAARARARAARTRAARPAPPGRAASARPGTPPRSRTGWRGSGSGRDSSCTLLGLRGAFSAATCAGSRAARPACTSRIRASASVDPSRRSRGPLAREAIRAPALAWSRRRSSCTGAFPRCGEAGPARAARPRAGGAARARAAMLSHLSRPPSPRHLLP